VSVSGEAVREATKYKMALKEPNINSPGLSPGDDKTRAAPEKEDKVKDEDEDKIKVKVKGIQHS